MSTAKTNYLADLASYVIRPALVEAKLITEKHGNDAVYVATLTEELRDIEAKILAMEESVQLDFSAAPNQLSACRFPEGRPDVTWIRTKSRELGLRLCRIEQSSHQLSPEPSRGQTPSDATPAQQPILSTEPASLSELLSSAMDKRPRSKNVLTTNKTL